jgi:hypothetical protein
VSISVHNPDQYIGALRTIIAQSRKRIGLLIGAGAPGGMPKKDGSRPLIPTTAKLTNAVIAALTPTYGTQFDALKSELAKHDIESLLSRVRSLSNVIGKVKVHGLDGDGYKAFGEAICANIGTIVNVRLPPSPNAYSEIVNWITGTNRDQAIEIFTTNYDTLFEEAFEAVHAPFFDGFTGSREPFFDPVSVARNDLPPRWTRLWKLHGSLGWEATSRGEVIRTGKTCATHLVFPEHLKYDQTQKAPYSAFLDRLRTFLSTPDTLLISIGCSFSDSHIASRIDEALAGNASASLFAFQYQRIAEEAAACDLGSRLPNFSVYARDQAMINGMTAPWRVPADLPSRDWAPIRATYWGPTTSTSSDEFLLGAFEIFARFFAASRSAQALGPATTSTPFVLAPAPGTV